MSDGDAPEGSVRARVIAFLAGSGEAGASLRDLSQAVSATEKDVAEHLEHVARSLAASGRRLVVTPPECLACGYVFEERTRAKRPGRCPRCRATRIRPPRFRVSE